MPDDQTTVSSQTANTQPAAEKEEATTVTPPVNQGDAAITFESEAALQAEIDRRLKDRLAREEQKRVAATEQARKEAEAKALQEQGKYKELAEEQAKELAAFQERAQGFEATAERVKALEGMVGSLIAPQLEAVPAPFRPLLERMTVEEQVAWLNDNRDALAEGAPRKGLPPSPGGTDSRAATTETKARERRQFRRSARSFF